MKVNLSTNNLYRNRLLKRGLEFVADNGALFAAGTSLTLATVVRPLSIYLTPKTDKENKKLACAKSIASSAVGFGLMVGASVPISNSVKKINNNPEKYLKNETIKKLKDTAKPLTSSKGYQFVTQLFKLGIGAVAAIPKSVITCALIPSIMLAMFKHDKSDKQNKVETINQKNTVKSSKNLTFKGKIPKEPLTNGIAKIIDSPSVQKFANKYKDTNYAMHISALTDSVATGAFIVQTKNNKKIKEERKHTLMYNAGISTGLSIGTSYIIDKVLDKPTEKIINKFKEVNKNSPKLDKYVEGIKIAKPTLILGGVYYCAIPLVSTFLADRVETGKNRIGNSKIYKN